MPADPQGPDAAAPQPVRDDEERLRIDGIAMVRLLGPQDRLLTSIQHEYPDVEVHVRGNEIAIRGDADDAHARAPSHRRTPGARAQPARTRHPPK